MASKRSRRFCQLFAAVLLLAGFLILTLLSYGLYLRSQADHLLADVKQLKAGESSFSDAELISRRYRRFRIIGGGSAPVSANPTDNKFPDDCTAVKCLMNFAIVNDPVSRFRLVQGAAVGATIAVSNAKVRYLEARISGGPHGVNGAIVTEVEESPRSTQFLYEFPTPVGKPYLHVQVTSAAPSGVRKRAWTLSTSCLISRTGCDIPCDYLPLAWQDWKTSLVGKGISEADFRISYRNDDHCK
jgi:hypothetical protein